jgi:hypothetical protein
MQLEIVRASTFDRTTSPELKYIRDASWFRLSDCIPHHFLKYAGPDVPRRGAPSSGSGNRVKVLCVLVFREMSGGLRIQGTRSRKLLVSN